MTKIFGLCPRCKSRIKINNVERLDGRKIACRDCGYTIRVRAARAKTPVKSTRARKARQELEIVEFYDDAGNEVAIDQRDADAAGSGDDDEFATVIEDDRELSTYRPLTRAAKPKKKPSPRTQESAGADSFVPAAATRGKKKISPAKIVGICVGLLVGFALGFAGVQMLRSGGSSAKFEPPENYVPIPLGMVPLAGTKPEGWKSTSGGGVRGIPIFITITDGGSISIDIRETEGSSAKGKMKQRLLAGQEVHQIGAPVGDPNRAPAVGDTHGFHNSVVMKNFSNYKETQAQPIETGFGEGLISDFTAEEGLFHGKVKGCRASLVHRDHQYSIVCKCKPAQFKEVKPVFEKVIASLHPDEGPGGSREPPGIKMNPLPVDADLRGDQ